MRIGPYRVVSEVARGGAGVIYRARHPEEPREVAIKLLLSGPHASPSARARFAREGRALRKLRHPHVVGVEDLGEHAGQPYLVLELLPGQSLQDRLDREGPLPIAEAVAIARKLAEALEHAHQQGLLHRDLKPDNVVFDAEGEPRLTDFGLTRDLDPQGSQTPVTVAGQAMGTPLYWPQEQARGQLDRVGPPSDVYALAGTLVAMLTGGPPHPPPANLFEAVRNAARLPPPPSSRRPGVPAPLDAVCLRALAVDPADRHASAQSLAQELLAVELQLGRDARPAGERARPLAIVGVVVVVALALAAAVWAPRGTPEAELDAGVRWEGELARMLEAEDYAGVLARCDEVLREHPDDATALFTRGQARIRLLDLTRAEADLRGALGQRPDHAPTLRELGVCLMAAGDVAGGLTALDSALRLDPSCPGARITRARAHVELDQPERALRDLDAVLQQAPDAATHMLRGRLRLEQGDPAGAREDFAAASRLDRDLLEAESLCARACAELGDVEGALASLDRALKRDPGRAEDLIARAELRLAAEQLDPAAVDLDKALRANPGAARAYALRAELRERRGDRAGALDDLRAAIGLAPESADYRVARANLLGKLDEIEAALEDANEALRLDPELAIAYRHRGALRFSQGDVTRALADYTRAIELDADQPWFYVNRGKANVVVGRYEEAFADYEAALQLDPTYLRAHLLRGELHNALFQHREAEAVYSAALRLEPDLVEALMGRGIARQGLLQPEAALDDLRRAQALAPENREIQLSIQLIEDAMRGR